MHTITYLRLDQFCGHFLFKQKRKQKSTIFHFEAVAVIPECTNYKVINDAQRSITYKGDIKCDSGLAEGWYRFEGSAGYRLPESPPAIHFCGTHAPGWLSGKHPSVEEGVVVRKVCYHWSGDNCQWSNDVSIVNCGGYFVYKLKKPPVCSLRYCVTKGTLLQGPVLGSG